VRYIDSLVSDLLKELKVDLSDDNFKDTPRRFADYLLQLFRTKKEDELALETFKKAIFPTSYSGMVILKGSECYGICPHHLLPVRYIVSIGYLPAGKVIGLSKLSRVADLCLQRPLLQETATEELAKSLSVLLETEDVAVVVSGNHMCMTVRGVRKGRTSTITSSLKGQFLLPEVRAEFLHLTEFRKEK